MTPPLRQNDGITTSWQHQAVVFLSSVGPTIGAEIDTVDHYSDPGSQIVTLVYLLPISLLALAAFVLAHHRRARLQTIGRLANRRNRFEVSLAPALKQSAPTASQRCQFAEGNLVAIPDFLESASLARLQQAALDAECSAERSYIPLHKQGGTVSYEVLHEQAPACIALYHDVTIRHWLEVLIGADLRPTPDDDQSSCSLLYYDAAGDHIGWHYDHNFYRGRHFTVLLSLINRDAQQASPKTVSAGKLQRQQQHQTSTVETQENTVVVFEGARVRHRATAVAQGDKRIMLSMTFCTDASRNPLKNLARRVKDTAYYGPRALFD